MKDYASMSDREIAEKIGKAIGLGNIGGCLYIKNGVWTRFDPCNNPADAWPIITESRIAIIPDTAAGEWVAFNEFTLYEGDWMFASDPAHHSNGKNPLRCAMIVFLMMKEGER